MTTSEPDRLAQIRQRAEQERNSHRNTRYGTHWEDCYLDHPWCAVLVLLDQLSAQAAQIATLEADEEVSVCKSCGDRVEWHKTRLLYDCTNCGRIDGSAKLEIRKSAEAQVASLSRSLAEQKHACEEAVSKAIVDKCEVQALLIERTGERDGLRDQIAALHAERDTWRSLAIIPAGSASLADMLAKAEAEVARLNARLREAQHD